MNESIWLPGLVVLATGLFLGGILAIKMRGQGGQKNQKKAAAADSPDLLLKLRDLEARRDDLYRRIRAADEDKLSDEEIQALEDAAALTLRDIDLIQGEVPQKSRQAASRRVDVATDGESAPPQTEAKPRTRNPLLVGFAFGAAMVAVVALLVYWAVEDAQPGPRMGPQATPTEAAGEPPHEGQIEVPPEVTAQLADLQNRLVADPGDLLARKQLALTYVAAGQFFEAFNQASQVLQQAPEDPDGLLVHGIVRLTMGQAEQAVGILDQVLAQHPDHRQALIYRGLALYQSGEVGQALDTWDMGLQMAGGSDSEFEELIQMAQSGASQPAGMASPAPPNSASASRPAQPPVDPNGYPMTIELAAGTSVAPQSTLFVFLRPEGSGPPVAARRITGPRFPVQISLGADDSMMGAELPVTGRLIAKVDTDGDIATTDPADLVAEVDASLGQPVRLTLAR